MSEESRRTELILAVALALVIGFAMGSACSSHVDIGEAVEYEAR